MSHKKRVEDNLAGIPSHVPDLRPGKVQRRDTTARGAVPAVQDHSEARAHHVNEKLSRDAKIVSVPPTRTTSNARRKGWRLGRRSARWFFDTANFGLYNNAFILRRRIQYQDGFPLGDPEIVFKFRHPDMQRAAEMDVRPQIPGGYDIKFKVEALPLKDRLGAYRLLYSHNVQFPLSETPEGDRAGMKALTRFFPVLASVLKTPADRVEQSVNQTIVEEVLQDLGTLDFGKGMAVKFNVALWRERGMHRPLVGEFAFQVKFKTHDELHRKAVDRVQRFFVALQESGRNYVLLGATKTGIVYNLKGNPPQAHE